MELSGDGNAVERRAAQAHQTVDDLARRANEKAGPAIDRVAQAAHQTVDKVAQAAGPAADWVSDSATRIRQRQDELVGASRDYIREQPLITVSVALALGYLIGRIGR